MKKDQEQYEFNVLFFGDVILNWGNERCFTLLAKRRIQGGDC